MRSCHEIVDLLERPVALQHLLVDRPEVLGPARDLVILDSRAAQCLLQRHAQPLDHLLALFPLRLDLLHQCPVVVRLQELEREVLELAADPRHAEPVGERRVDLPRLLRDRALLLGREVLQRAHVVQAIGQLHDDHPCVPRDGQQQLAVVLRLLLGRGPEGQSGDLREPIHDVRHLIAEILADVLEGDLGVLSYVVQQRGGDRDRVHLLPHQDLGHRDGVRDEVVARQALLSPVRRLAGLERTLHELQIEPIPVLVQDLRELFVDRVERDGHSSPASAKLKYRSPATIT